MGRKERPVDPAEGPLQRFAWELRQLREAAGRPTYRSLAAKVHYSASMLAEAAGGREMPTLAVTLAYVRGCDGDVEEWQRRWKELTPDDIPVSGESPYQGLSTFEAADADRFFGRADLTAELVARMAEAPLLAVFGASGSGKSSLLRAGLVPAWEGPSVVFTPGAEPLKELAAALPAEPDDVLLVVDQFEEVFTLCRDEDERTRFIDSLLDLAGPARLVLGVRADFYAHCASHARLVAALRDRQLLVGPMSDTDLRAVITGPAQQAGCKAEPALVEAIVTDAAGQAGALPLVSHALLETWHRKQGSTLTLDGYRAAGGVADAIAQTAERAYARLDGAKQKLAEQVFLRLTALGDGTEDTRRRVAQAELPDGPEARDVLAGLTAARLITYDHDTVTVAHEALIRSWPRLRGWLTADRELLREHRRLTEATGEWEQHGRDEAFLYRGKRLAPWDGRPSDHLNPAELAFLAAGRHREQRELNVARRRTRRTVSLLSAAVVVVTALGVVSAVQARRAAGERDVAYANQLAADAREQLSLKPDLSLLLARRAMTIRSTPAAESALRQAAADSRVRAMAASGQGQVFGVSYDGTGKAIATSHDNGTVQVWRQGADGAAMGPPRVLRGHKGEVWSPAFSADGRMLAAAGIDGTVTVWDVYGSDKPRILSGHDARVWTVAFSPDGRSLASTGDDDAVHIWDPATGAERAVLPMSGGVAKGGGWQIGVAYSADGRFLAAGGGDGLVRVWNAAGTGKPRELRGHTGSVESMAFSRDGRTLVTGSIDGTARVWPIGRSGSPVVLRGQNGGTVETVSINPTGDRVAAGGSDGTIRVFNTDSDTDPLLLPGHDGPVWSVTFSPDGRHLLSGSGDGTMRVWDATYPGDAHLRRGHAGAVWTTVLAPDGRKVVTGGDDGTVRIWPVAGGEAQVFKGEIGAIQGVAMSPDGARVAAGGDRLQVWDIATGRTLALSDDSAFDVAFLPDGRVVSVGDDGQVRVWDATTRKSTVLPGPAGSTRSVAASSDGRHVAAAGRDSTVRIWDVTGDAPATVLRGHEGGLVWRVVFSPDGRYLASGGSDGKIIIRDVTGARPPVVLRGHRGSVWGLSYSPDGRMLASSGADGGMRIWRLDQPSTATVLRGFGSPVEGVALGPDGYTTVHDDGTVRLSRCDVCAPIDRIEELAERLTTRDLTADERKNYLTS
ncbi:hypothetical protein [Actinoplanes sp. NBRC 103695]|uniref:nSTAND1 domain-containing NTPase n=1 Tax=Actinoplanes sp. NBRC 103695 TaxID=3032202 RepID=UPI0024A5D12C|nr:hypothetical protein [Actinoplanes sp. NBRC 103695]GLY97534.1 hypothetical protein Acsp02_47880 [Actinoplanes sp. NBRC 103695]